MAIGLSIVAGHLARTQWRWYDRVSRNFYGVLKVNREYNPAYPDYERYTLLHGRITHGYQYVSEPLHHSPTSYYGAKSGVGLALLNHPREDGLRVGAIGLGTGSLAVYGQEGDHYTFYEINPAVVTLSATEAGQFGYLGESKALVDVVLGDARLSLERQAPQDFDVLVLDAFSSDAIPVHLLTREAARIYLRHMKPDGVIAVHISNRHLDLEPVVWALADAFGLQGITISDNHPSTEDMKGIEKEEGEVLLSSTWMLLARRRDLLDFPDVAFDAPVGPEGKTVMWTDQYSNLFQIMRWR